jgi:hypothetical protein
LRPLRRLGGRRCCADISCGQCYKHFTTVTYGCKKIYKPGCVKKEATSA